MATSRLSLGARLRLVVVGLLLFGFGGFMAFGGLDSLLWGGATAVFGAACLALSVTGRTVQSYL